MALVHADRVKESTTSTGTGTINLGGAEVGYRTFVSGIGNGNTCYYCIDNTTGEWEVGLGTVTSGTPATLSRSTVLASSNAGSLVNFSAGTKYVFCTHPGAKTVVHDSNDYVTIKGRLVKSTSGVLAFDINDLGTTSGMGVNAWDGGSNYYTLLSVRPEATVAGEQNRLEIRSTTSASNANGPRLISRGTGYGAAGVVRMELASKGWDTTSGFTFNTLQSSDDVASPLFYVRAEATPAATSNVVGVYANASGSAPVIRAVGGTDANINLDILAKGTGAVRLNGTTTTVASTGKLTTTASAAGQAGLNVPHGTAPSAPTDGDVWTTTAGMYVRINGGTVGPFGVGSSGFSGYSGVGTSGFSGYSGAGASGFSGYSGISGFSGYSGRSGYSGISGFSGYSGVGTSGFSGYSGVGTSGFSGYSGAGQSGFSGYSGISGFSGYSGRSGYSGIGTSGFSGYSGVGTSGFSGYSGSYPANNPSFTGDMTVSGSMVVQNSQSAAYTLVASDANKHILHPAADTTARTFTIPANSSVAYAVGTVLTFINQNGAGTVTIAINTDTMRLAGAGTTGSRTLAANGVASAIKITSTEWIISGTGLT